MAMAIFCVLSTGLLGWLMVNQQQLRYDIARKSGINAMDIIDGLFARADEQLEELAGNRIQQESMFSFSPAKGWAEW